MAATFRPNGPRWAEPGKPQGPSEAEGDQAQREEELPALEGSPGQRPRTLHPLQAAPASPRRLPRSPGPGTYMVTRLGTQEGEPATLPVDPSESRGKVLSASVPGDAHC